MRGPGFSPVTKFATCKHCGDQQLAWLKSRSGKWFLARAYATREHGQHYIYANAFEPHRCPNRSPNA